MSSTLARLMVATCLLSLATGAYARGGDQKKDGHRTRQQHGQSSTNHQDSESPRGGPPNCRVRKRSGAQSDRSRRCSKKEMTRSS